jgi:hypothetical protein
MKILAVGMVILVLATGLSLHRQGALQNNLALLQAENQRLSERITQMAAVSPDEIARIRSDWQSSQAALREAERRLSQIVKSSSLSEPSHDRRAPSPNVIEPPPSRDPSKDPVGPVSSSHSREGQLLQRPWGPEQLVGPPNTHEGGDIATAWAPRQSSGTGEEWVHVNYDRAVELAEIRVRETYNPGAISRVAAVLPTGREVVLWQGVEPAAEAPVDTTFPLPPGVTARSLRIYLDRTRAPGWNEIDAVELVGKDGSRQWASSASTSSSYAEPPIEPALPGTDFLNGSRW